MRRFRLITCTTAVALLLAGCASGGDDPDDGSANLAAGEGSGCVSEGAEPDAEPLPDGELAPGEHTTSLLGTGVTFTTEKPWITAFSVGEALLLRPPKPADVAGTRQVLMLRGAELQGAQDAGLDIEAWGEERPDVEVKGRRETTVGECSAVVYDLTAGEETALMPSVAGPILLLPNQTARVWVIEQGEQDPMVVHVAVDNLDRDWLGTVDAIVESMELAVAPGPGLQAGPACGEEGYPIGEPTGSYTTTQFTLRQFSFDRFSCAEPVEPGPGLVALPLLAEDPQSGPAVLFSAPVATDDGTPLPDAQALLDAAASAGSELEAAGRVTILGKPATGYKDVGKALGPVALSDEKDAGILDLKPVDITYPLDTRQGLVLVSAVADDAEDLPAAKKLLKRTASSFGWAG